MSTEPERDIEKTLRAYAKKRAEDAGAPAEMHPATRRLLQGEVARLRGRKADKPNFWARVLGGAWPQVAVRVSLLVVLASAAVLLMLPVLSRSKSKSKSVQPLAELSLLQKEAEDRNHSIAQMEAAKAPAPNYGASEQAQNLRKAIGGTSTDTSFAGQKVFQNTPTAAGQPAEKKNATTPADKFQVALKSAQSVNGQDKEGFANKNSSKLEFSNPGGFKETAFADASKDAAANLTNHLLDNGPSSLNDKSALTVTVAPPPAPTAAPPALALASPAASTPTAGTFDTGVAADHAAVSGGGGSLLPPPSNYIEMVRRYQLKSEQPSDITAANGNIVASDGKQRALTNAVTLTWTTNSFQIANSFAQRFARSTPSLKTRETTPGPAQIVLTSFRVEQAGDQIRVIDSDGSVYSGFIAQAAGETARQARAELNGSAVPPAFAATASNSGFVGQVAGGAAPQARMELGESAVPRAYAATAAKKEPVTTDSLKLGAVQPIQYFSFRVTGTNRSLNQAVVFNARIVPNVKPGASGKMALDNGQNWNNSSSATASGSNDSWQLLRSQLLGRAIVGGSNQIEIKAVPVNP